MAQEFFFRDFQRFSEMFRIKCLTVGDNRITYLTCAPDGLFEVIACVSCVWKSLWGELI